LKSELSDLVFVSMTLKITIQDKKAASTIGMAPVVLMVAIGSIAWD
jgi:hypothetical protein